MTRYDRQTAWGIVLIAVGLAFLADRALGLDLGRQGWPAIVVGVGLLLLVIGLASVDPSRASVIPGSIVTTVGLILWYQNTYDHYESWAYAWALIPAAVGVGRAIHASLTRSAAGVREGVNLAGSFAIVFLVGLAFFEGVVNISGRGSDALVSYALPIGLILLGLWLLAGRVLWRS